MMQFRRICRGHSFRFFSHLRTSAQPWSTQHQHTRCEVYARGVRCFSMMASDRNSAAFASCIRKLYHLVHPDKFGGLSLDPIVQKTNQDSLSAIHNIIDYADRIAEQATNEASFVPPPVSQSVDFFIQMDSDEQSTSSPPLKKISVLYDLKSAEGAEAYTTLFLHSVLFEAGIVREKPKKLEITKRRKTADTRSLSEMFEDELYEFMSEVDKQRQLDAQRHVNNMMKEGILTFDETLSTAEIEKAITEFTILIQKHKKEIMLEHWSFLPVHFVSPEDAPRYAFESPTRPKGILVFSWLFDRKDAVSYIQQNIYPLTEEFLMLNFPREEAIIKSESGGSETEVNNG
eukprot:448514_1